MLRFFIKFNGQRIGSTDLELADEAMGVAYGRFHPEPPYAAVRPDVIRSAEARQERRSDIVPPPFELTTNHGEPVRTVAVVIDDFEDVAVDPEIAVFFENYKEFQRLLGSASFSPFRSGYGTTRN